MQKPGRLSLLSVDQSEIQKKWFKFFGNVPFLLNTEFNFNVMVMFLLALARNKCFICVAK